MSDELSSRGATGTVSLCRPGAGAGPRSQQGSLSARRLKQHKHRGALECPDGRVWRTARSRRLARTSRRCRRTLEVCIESAEGVVEGGHGGESCAGRLGHVASRCAVLVLPHSRLGLYLSRCTERIRVGSEASVCRRICLIWARMWQIRSGLSASRQYLGYPWRRSDVCFRSVCDPNTG